MKTMDLGTAMLRTPPVPAAGETDNLRAVAREFESLFTHMLLKNMRAGSLADGAMDSKQSEFYQDMFDQKLGQQLSTRGSLGIADMLVRQLGNNHGDEPVAPPLGQAVGRFARPGNKSSISAEVPVAVEQAVQENQATEPGSPLQFVEQALPHARRIGQQLGVEPRYILAQAALESGWGSRPIRNEDGSDSHNLFGIKATGGWEGRRAMVGTVEYRDGIAQREKASFRSYESLGDAFDDYAKLLLDNPRYKDALQKGSDGAGFASALSSAGYATDPAYAEKILKVAHGRTLNTATVTLNSP